MKNFPIAIIAATLILIALVASRATKQVDEKETPSSSPQPVGTTPAPSNPTPTPDLSIYKTDPKWIWWNKQRARDPRFEWKMPIRFYGKVIDENGHPVAGATASFIWTDMSLKGSSTAELVSDGLGLFSLESVRGKRLQVRVSKEGYYTNPKNAFSFEYAAFFETNYHEPDREDPVVFRLRKVGEVPKDLLVRESLIGLMSNGTAQPIDLRRASKGSSGDMAISITRSDPKEGKKFDWSVAITGINGAGLIESDEPFMFEAPSEGYLPQYSYQFEASSPDWKNQLRKKYFVRSGDGRVYASLEINFMPRYQRGAAARVRFFVNPTGSRNLEYQPNEVLPR